MDGSCVMSRFRSVMYLTTKRHPHTTHPSPSATVTGQPSASAGTRHRELLAATLRMQQALLSVCLSVPD